MKRIVCLGGGPAGLYSAILFKKALPDAKVEVCERNRPDDTFGWGVVFSDKTMAGFRDADAPSHDAIVAELPPLGRHRRALPRPADPQQRPRVLRHRAQAAAEHPPGAGRGARSASRSFQHEIDSAAEFADADLIVAADGVNSVQRRRHADIFKPHIDVRKCRFIWLGTEQKFPAFTFAFENTEHGWFQIHAYQFSADLSTVIVETREETWKAHGLDGYSTEQSIEFCEELFGKYLGGNRLMSNARHLRGSAWLNFNRVLCERWHHGNLVLIGDAAHTAHFGIGSGTKLAMEDAMSLVSRVATAQDVGAGLERYHAERNLEALKLQSAARNRMEWFENVARYTHLEPQQFAYSLLTASQRIGHANLRLRDPQYVDAVERDLARRSGLAEPRPPMFLPLELGSMQLVNRVVVSPMAQYLAQDGMPGDWHLMHYGARAAGGAGLVVTEMTCITPDARISPGCTGLWSAAHRDAWRRIVDFVHRHSPAKIALQLGHAGRKGSTQLGWQEMDHPLPAGNWPLISASATPYLAGLSQTPRAMTAQDFARVTAEFVVAARLGAEAGFDMLELHMAHGYLLASFLSPLTNRRRDEYGGPVENRLRYPLEVLRAVRAAWPAERPLSVRISAHDWAPGGLDEADLIAVARAFKHAGAAALSVSTGQTVPEQQPVYGRMWQTPFADMIRNVVGIPTIAVGNIFEADHVNTIIGAGRADLCAIARPHLADSAWTLHAAASQRYASQWWPDPYLPGKGQLEHNLERAALAVGAV